MLKACLQMSLVLVNSKKEVKIREPVFLKFRMFIQYHTDIARPMPYFLNKHGMLIYSVRNVATVISECA